MATRTGYLVTGLDYGADLPDRSANLLDAAMPAWRIRLFEASMSHGAGLRTPSFPVTSHAPARTGFGALSYADDYFDRIHVKPLSIELGNLVGAQVRQIVVWNAWRTASRTMTSADVVNGDGMTVTPPGAMPLTLRPLQEVTFGLSIDTSGSPIIDATLSFEFTTDAAPGVTITGRRLQAWPVPADWGSSITETLEWLSDMQLSVDGSVDAEPLRGAPRRTWEFDLLRGGAARRIIENATYDWTGRVWVLPVMPDVSRLPSALPAGSATITVDTAGLDFATGGLAMLWRDVTQYELVEIATVGASALTLARATLQPWPSGTRIWPVRTARLTEAPTWTRSSDSVIKSRVRFEAVEPCDWPAAAPGALYRGYPVLDPGDWNELPTLQPARELTLLDGDVGLVSVADITGLAWSRQSHMWTLHGRSQRDTHRRLLYWLQGQVGVLWVPTFAADVVLRDTVVAGSTTLVVDWAGMTQHLRGQPGRRHLRIDLGSAIHYREVVASAELDAERESLTLDSGLPSTVQPSQVRMISWMMLARRSSDHVEIAHITDSEGVARVRDSFVFAGIEEPHA
ncbi:hypothetical protein [Thermomonas sp.]|uniref:hypothetical protein n=1 Tax=Thermomonas sp. TaxID=1971895 RepID=UPI0026396643|nr:hypothetical protein [Thermomonas sp.]